MTRLDCSGVRPCVAGGEDVTAVWAEGIKDLLVQQSKLQIPANTFQHLHTTWFAGVPPTAAHAVYPSVSHMVRD